MSRVEPFHFRPLYGEELRLSSSPQTVTEFKWRARAADVHLTAMSEYNHSFSYVTKNAVGWISVPPAASPLSDKPVGSISGSDGYFSATCAKGVNALRVGVIGFGQIGRGVVDAIKNGEAGNIELAAILVRDKVKASAVGASDILTVDADRFLAADFEMVVELGGHDALRQYAVEVLDAGKDLLTLSVGAFADASFLERVTEAALRNGQRVLVPSGAIAGLDMITAAALAPIDSATHTTRKNPRAFTAEQLGGQEPDKEAVLLFDGPARDGVARFPENVNVAAAVSIAGIGLDRTRLRVYADPNVERNQHEVEVRGYFGRVRIQVENIPSDNPKTGRIVALSVVRALRNQTAPFVIGL